MSKLVKVMVTAEKAAQLRRESRYQEILSFLLSDRRRLDKRIKRIKAARDKRREAEVAAFQKQKAEYAKTLHVKV
jgi:hypothetical protein